MRYFAVIAFAILIALPADIAAAVEPTTAPHCATSNSTVICIADLDGTGKQNVIVGHMPAYQPDVAANAIAGDSYLFIFNSNGSIRKRLCLSNGSGPGGRACIPYELK
jgi:hypothetical protein